MEKKILTVIDISNSQRLLEIKDSMNILHGIVYSSFSNKNSEKLFQYDNRLKEIRILSKEIPDKIHLSTELDVPANKVRSYDYSLKMKQVEKGKQYKFFLIGNPVVTRFDKRIPLKTFDERKAWITKKANKSGFSINSVSIHGFPVLIKDGTTYNGVRFTGTLKVTDAELFKQAVSNGIGHAKAFGFGLLWVEQSE
jgi:CRISPR system Cascade subunit CasE